MHFLCKILNLAMNYHARQFQLKVQNKSDSETRDLAVGQQFHLQIYFVFSVEICQAWKFIVKFRILHRKCMDTKFFFILPICTLDFNKTFGASKFIPVCSIRGVDVRPRSKRQEASEQDIQLIQEQWTSTVHEVFNLLYSAVWQSLQWLKKPSGCFSVSDYFGNFSMSSYAQIMKKYHQKALLLSFLRYTLWLVIISHYGNMHFFV